MRHEFKALMAAERSLPPTRTAQLADGPLEYLTDGDGEPGIILLNDFGMPMSGWALVFPKLAKISTVFACDHLAGVGRRAAARRPATGTGQGTAIVDQLRGGLAAAGIEPPFVVVGHALGGLYANLWARLFPQELAGLVLLDATHPDDDILERHVRFFPRTITRVLMAKTITAQQRFVTETALEIAHAGPCPDVPLTVITGGKTPPLVTTSPKQVRSHAARQKQLVALSAIGKQIVAPSSGHYPQITEPEIVVQAVREIVTWSCRSSAPAPLVGVKGQPPAKSPPPLN
jgi:pimeloyl-ACP methyl ester carboxylesterase